jgi:hypothetical protein
VWIFLVWYQIKISCLKFSFFDEVTFHVSSKVNMHNCRILAPQNPRSSIELQPDSPNVNVFCAALSEQEVCGPFIFAESTLTCACYLDMPDSWLWLQITKDIPHDLIHFQQDGAPTHYHRELRQFLDDQLPGRWSRRAGPIPWPPKSPDLKPLEFFLWGYVKEHGYFPPLPRTVRELNERIFETIV